MSLVCRGVRRDRPAVGCAELRLSRLWQRACTWWNVRGPLWRRIAALCRFSVLVV